jgi:hypothetical protein
MNRYNLHNFKRPTRDFNVIQVGDRVKYIESFWQNIVFPLRGTIVGERDDMWIIKWDFNEHIHEYEPGNFVPGGVEERKRNICHE